MNNRDDIDRLRESWSRRTRQDERSGCPENAFVGKVTSTTITAGHFGKVLPQLVTGGECEGCSATTTDAAAVDVIVYNRGPGDPSAGDLVVVKWVRDRWVTRRKGTSGGGGADCGCYASDSIPSTLSWSADWGYYDGDGVWHLLGTTSGSLTYDADIHYGGVSGTVCNLDVGLLYTRPTWSGWIGELSCYIAAFDFAGEPYNITELPGCRTFSNFGITGEGNLSTCTVDCCNYLTVLCSDETNISGTPAKLWISTYRSVSDCANGDDGYEDCTNNPQFPVFGSTPDTGCDPFYYRLEVPLTELQPCVPPDYPSLGQTIYGRIEVTE